MSVILGIDLGTSSVKAMLLDSVKGVISVESSPYEVSIPFEGYAEQNPETWWLETKQVLGRLRDKMNRNSTRFRQWVFRSDAWNRGGRL